LNCSNNLLTDIDLNSVNPEKIKTIYLRNNNFSSRDLTCFSKFTNLKIISVGDNFSGSLEPLKNLIRLSSVTVVGTNIDSGLEYLPESVKSLGFFGEAFVCPQSSSYADLG